jgi:hypothetical protein
MRECKEGGTVWIIDRINCSNRKVPAICWQGSFNTCDAYGIGLESAIESRLHVKVPQRLTEIICCS